MLVLIDNYDSFTFNLAQYFGQLGCEPTVIRNDAIDMQALADFGPSRIVISPGPKTPSEAGVSTAVIEHFTGRVGIFGVCLGHQSIAQVFGAAIVRAERVMHGKLSKVFHDDKGVFEGLQNPMIATRYHSLLVERATLPPVLEITAKTWEDEIMGIRHRDFVGTATPIEGVQFHPESIKTEDGMGLLQNFLRLSED
ncbi:MAG: aminodeoxychorismate/anthranilate synthase component II [Myxococcales bacterium]|nr:aminodeoxychorismate/anthranilate synthase component II [Myxococcales bacterium]